MTFKGFGALQRVMDLHRRFAEPYERLTKIARMYEQLGGSNRFIQRNSVLDSMSIVSGNHRMNNNHIFFENIIKSINGNIPDFYKTKFDNIFRLQDSINESFLKISGLNIPGHIYRNDLFIRSINNSLLIALTAVTLQQEWDETETYEETLEKTVEFFESASGEISIDDNYLSKISSHLNELIVSLSDNKANLGKALFILTVIGTILGIIGFMLQLSDNTKEEVKNEINKSNQVLYKKIQKELEKKYELVLEKVENKKIAVRITGLMTFPKSGSSRLGLIKEGQIVTVTEIRSTWILVSYLDKDSHLPKTGWVLKKYFTPSTKQK